ncbi:MAG: RsmE family RNA methyltransferase, partial [Rectinema sp.]|nr:RsmE family RNA methyltransferase [Rectinema sp.]
MRQILLPGDLRGTSTCRLDRKTAHYLVDVRRLQTGAVFPVVDERGNRFRATLRRLRQGEAEVALEPLEEQEAAACVDASTPADARAISVTSAPFALALVQALPKGQKFDLIIRQAVELGTSLIVPLITQFCVAREQLDEAQAKLERRKRI